MTQRWAVHKFGGASVRDAAGVRNLSAILKQLAVGDDAGLGQAVVVSAMGKTTNALEVVWQALPQATDVEPVIAEVVDDHRAVVQALGLPPGVLEPDVDRFREACEDWRGRPLSDEGYDALVGFGERWSTRIVAAHLESEGMPAVWASAWSMVRTDAHHRAARVDLAATAEAIQRSAMGWQGRIPIVQGFVGATAEGQPTTLGREGSDFSGALLAEALGARRFCVWKDVPGVMTGDPRTWPAAEVLTELDHETAELLGRAGAGVLHPDTMAPLRRTGIPLHVRSFMEPSAAGTCIRGDVPPAGLPALWTVSPEESGLRTVRCIGGDEVRARSAWQAQFPQSQVVEAGPDPELPRCLRLVVRG